MSREINEEYPSKYETEIRLKNGERVLLRPIKREDTDSWLAFVSRLSLHTKYLRFHHVPKQMNMDDALRFCTVDYRDAFAFVAEIMKEKQRDIIAIGRYYRLPGERSAEAAIVVEDSYRKNGIGTKIINWLTNVAIDNGIDVFEADILEENTEIMGILRGYGFHIRSDLEAGVYHVTFPITEMRWETKRDK